MTDQLAGDLDDEAATPGSAAPADGQTDVEPESTVAAGTEDVGLVDESAPIGTDDPAPTGDGGDTSATTSKRLGRRAQRRRVSKWDRPPDPHDWRFWVGNVGKVLIATGVLMFGFVAYQLWGTGIETARAQNRLENEFEQLLAEFADGDVDENPATDDGSDTDDGAGSTDTDDGTSTPEDPTIGSDGTSTTDDPPADDQSSTVDITVGQRTQGVPIALDLSDEAVVQDPLPQPARGDPLFRLEIPAIGRDDIVVAGVSLDDLKDGPGHYNDTPLPGQLGNASVAGHRTTYGAPFFNVDQLSTGDEIVTTLANGDRFVYEVTGVEVVTAADYWVVTTRDPNIAELTLTSCHPKYTARDRIVVHSVLNPEKSSNVGFPTFYDLEPDDTPIPGDDPVLVAAPPDANDIEITGPTSALADPDDIADAPAGDEIDTAGESAATDETEPAADPAGGGSPSSDDDTSGTAADEDTSSAAAAAAAPSTSGGDPTDAFSQGWFDDDGAWLQIALWGVALTIISLLAYQVSKRTRHDSIGFLAGIAPFMFCLYFFFQNIHRLLPPGI